MTPTQTWVADADWAVANGVEGQSQVDAYQKDGLYAAGSATFIEESALFQVSAGCARDGDIRSPLRGRGVTSASH